MHMHGVVHVRGACVLQRIATLRCPCGAPAVPLQCPCGAPAIPLRPVGRCAVRRVLALQRQRSMCTAHTLPTQECPRTTHVLHVRTCARIADVQAAHGRTANATEGLIKPNFKEDKALNCWLLFSLPRFTVVSRYIWQ